MKKISNEHFSAPRKLIDRAKNALVEADQVLREFVNNSNFPEIEEFDVDTGEYVLKVVQTADIPDRAAERITDAINNTKNAFDQTIYAACASIGNTINGGYYPWVDSEDILISTLEGTVRSKSRKSKPIPSEFWEIIKAHEPYPRNESDSRGRTLIRKMAHFANRKHTVGLDVQCEVSDVFYHSINSKNGTLKIFHPTWDPQRRQLELMRWTDPDAPRIGKHKQIFNIVFDASAPAEIRTVSAVNAVDIFADFAQQVLHDFERVVTEIFAQQNANEVKGAKSVDD